LRICPAADAHDKHAPPNGASPSEGLPVKGLLGISRVIDRFHTVVGRWVAWLIFVAVVISTVNAVIRKVFDTSSNSWLELQWVLFGAVFLLCAPWTLLSNEHIRIDVVNSMFSKKVRNWIDILGHVVFLMPFCAVMLITSWPFFLRSSGINEQSLNAGGLPQWPAKFLIPLGFFLLMLQAISELIKRIAIMRGDMEDTTTGGGHHAAAEAEAQRLLDAQQAAGAIAR
jgi:TRAP-type mannitol/chloroaromatic compound transport system permease small subunit